MASPVTLIKKNSHTVNPQLVFPNADTQMGNVDMQSALQTPQQTLEMVSTLSKLIIDTNMSIIREIGA